MKACTKNRLGLLGEVKPVGRRRIYGILQPFQHFLAHLLAQLAFLRIVIGQCQPESYASMRTPHGLQMGNLVISFRDYYSTILSAYSGTVSLSPNYE